MRSSSGDGGGESGEACSIRRSWYSAAASLARRRAVDRIRAEARRWAQPIAIEQVRFVASTLGGDAGLFGAGRLAMFANGGMKPSSSRALFVCACLCLLTFGIVFTMVGTVLLSVMERFGIDKTAGGALLLLMTFGVLLGALIFGPIVDRRGYKAMLLGSTAFIIVGLEEWHSLRRLAGFARPCS